MWYLLVDFLFLAVWLILIRISLIFDALYKSEVAKIIKGKVWNLQHHSGLQPTVNCIYPSLNDPLGNIPPPCSLNPFDIKKSWISFFGLAPTKFHKFVELPRPVSNIQVVVISQYKKKQLLSIAIGLDNCRSTFIEPPTWNKWHNSTEQ